MNLMIRRREMIRMGGKKEDYVLTKKDQPILLAAFYNAGLCESPDYMTVAEAATITNTQLRNVNFRNVDFNGEDFSGFKFFTSVTKIYEMQFFNAGVGEISLPSSITVIDTQGLRGIGSGKGIKGIRVPASVKSISKYSLYDIGGMYNSSTSTCVIFDGTTVPTLGQGSTGDQYINTHTTIYCPDESVADYQAVFTDNTVLGISNYTGTL